MHPKWDKNQILSKYLFLKRSNNLEQIIMLQIPGTPGNIDIQIYANDEEMKLILECPEPMDFQKAK